MNLSRDSKEFIELLNSRGVDYVVVGAHSLAFHGRPRYTGDLDILIRPTIDNAAKLIEVLNTFGFRDAGFTEADLVEPGQVLQLGRPPHRIDLLTSLSGLTVDEAFADRLAADIEGLPVFVLSRENLIRNKRAVGRPQDLADLADLQQ